MMKAPQENQILVLLPGSVYAVPRATSMILVGVPRMVTVETRLPTNITGAKARARNNRMERVPANGLS